MNKVLNVYTGLEDLPIICEVITDAHWSDNDQDYPLDKFSKDIGGLYHENIHVYDATWQQVIAHLRERRVRIFDNVQKKTQPQALLEIYRDCEKNHLDMDNALEQIQGELYVNTTNLFLAREVGRAAFEIIKSYGSLNYKGFDHELRVKFGFIFKQKGDNYARI